MNTNVASSFDLSASAYDEVLRRNEAGARLLVDALPEGRYPHVLDVGCGTGFASLLMADRRGATHIVGVDPSAGMLDRFREKLAGRDDLTVELHQADVMSMPAAAGTADAVVSSMAFHWFPDKPAALRAMAAALAPGGVLGILTSGWGTDRELQAVMAAMRPELPEALVGVFDHVQVRPADMDDWMRAAGLEPVDIWMEVRLRHQDPDAYLERIYAVSSHMTASMPDDVREALDQALRRDVRAASGPAGFRFTFAKLFAVARKPG